MSPDSPPRSVLDLTAMKAAGRKIVMLTCYDATFADRKSTRLNSSH